ncbi:hypothetical protein PENSTE_c013G00825 [Penicillium steckii]|uniref:Uncharacterized protein n=1 Tax=Penicillium steckii TaxID=303698 RepID=A0A1V6T3L9_9EURO|nr:hypothetical protein PENSTE_c013G00825 [Penicillium steckii]
MAYGFAESESKYSYREAYVEQLSSEVRKKAQNTFLWVSLVFKVLAQLKDWRALEKLGEIPEGLEGLYKKMMAHIDTMYEDEKVPCKAVLGATCVARRPLSYQEMHLVAGISSEIPIKDIIQLCGSFLAVQKETVHLLHHTAGQWLAEHFQSDQANGEIERIHQNMATHSVVAMSKKLRFNMYDMDPATPAHDMQLPGSNNPPFFHWLESLSLINKIPSASPAIKKLLVKAESNTTETSALINFLKDAERFTTRNLEIMAEAPLQIYASALVFSQEKSLIKSFFWDQRPSYVASITGLADGWGEVVFDGKTVATISREGTVELWDTESGICKKKLERTSTKEDELTRGLISAAQFSPDRTLIAIVLNNPPMVEMWDVATSDYSRIPRVCENRYLDWIHQIQFSKDGDLLAIGATEHTQVWDISSKVLIQQISLRTAEQDHSLEQRIALSPDGNTLAVIYLRTRVEIFHISSAEKRQTLNVSLGETNFSFTDDGKYLKTREGFLFVTNGVLEIAHPELSQSVINVDKSWIVRCGKRLTRVPADYNVSEVYAYHGKTLVLADVDGKVVFLDFADD